MEFSNDRSRDLVSIVKKGLFLRPKMLENHPVMSLAIFWWAIQNYIFFAGCPDNKKLGSLGEIYIYTYTEPEKGNSLVIPWITSK